MKYAEMKNLALTDDVSLDDFQTALWGYVEDQLEDLLPHSNLPRELLLSLARMANTPGASCFGARSILLNNGFTDIYEAIKLFIELYTESHPTPVNNWSYSSIRRIQREISEIQDSIAAQPTIVALKDCGHTELAYKCCRVLENANPGIRHSKKKLSETLHDIRADRFFEVLYKVLQK